jgi:hypothetical protein
MPSTSLALTKSRAKAGARFTSFAIYAMKRDDLLTANPSAGDVEVAQNNHEIQNKHGQKLSRVDNLRQRRPR